VDAAGLGRGSKPAADSLASECLSPSTVRVVGGDPDRPVGGLEMMSCTSYRPANSASINSNVLLRDCVVRRLVLRTEVTLS
jgi:hypothetical protein